MDLKRYFQGRVTFRDRAILTTGCVMTVLILYNAAHRIQAPANPDLSNSHEDRTLAELVGDRLPMAPMTPWPKYIGPDQLREIPMDDTSLVEPIPTSTTFNHDIEIHDALILDGVSVVDDRGNRVLELDLKGHYRHPPQWDGVCKEAEELNQYQNGISALLYALARAEHHPCNGSK